MTDVKEMAQPGWEVNWQAWETAEEAANAFEGNICDSGLVARTVLLQASVSSTKNTNKSSKLDPSPGLVQSGCLEQVGGYIGFYSLPGKRDHSQTIKSQEHSTDPNIMAQHETRDEFLRRAAGATPAD